MRMVGAPVSPMMYMSFWRACKTGTPWAKGNEYVVSVELGVEPQDGTGDITMFNYRVWK